MKLETLDNNSKENKSHFDIKDLKIFFINNRMKCGNCGDRNCKVESANLINRNSNVYRFDFKCMGCKCSTIQDKRVC